MIPRLVPALAAAALIAAPTAQSMAAGEGQSHGAMKEDPGGSSSASISHAVAVLHPTKGNEVMGTIEFTQADQGVKVSADAQGLPPGGHGYHVHLYGDCSSPDGKSAGTHFNFEGSSKNPPEDIDRITGNLGNLEAGDDGKAKASTTLKTASLQGPHSIIGRGVIVHAKPNDPESPPIGAAGSRLACGVIGIAEGSS